MYLSLYCKGLKRLFKVLLWEGVGDRTELQYIDPHSYGRQRCVFLILQDCSTRGPGAQLSQLLWTSTHQGLQGPLRPDMAFPTTSHLYNSNSNCNCRTSVLTELYNSSTPTQSPTQSLEWNVWLSSSGNNCHAVQRSLSSGASVYECIMGFFLCPILLARSTYTIFPHKCHRNVSLPSGASPWNGIFGRIEGENTTTATKEFNFLQEIFLVLFQDMNCSTNLCYWSSVAQRKFGEKFQINIKWQNFFLNRKHQWVYLFFFKLWESY